MSEQKMENPYDKFGAHPCKVTAGRVSLWIFSILFLLGISIPPILRNVNDAKKTESRWVPVLEFWNFPNAKDDDALAAKKKKSSKIKRTEPSLRDHLGAVENEIKAAGFCKSIAKNDQKIITSVFNEGNLKVTVGRDGWYFYQPGIDGLAGYGPLKAEPDSVTKDPDRPEWFAQLPVIEKFTKQLRERGIELMLVPVPVKPMIHPEFLSEGIKAPLRHRDQEALYEKLRGMGIDLVDLTDDLMTWKADLNEGEALYLKQDTHWTHDTMERVAAVVAERVKAKSWYGDVAKNLEVKTESVKREWVGDMVNMLTEDSPGENYSAETQKIVRVLDSKTGAPPASDLGSPIALLGDSFVNVFDTPSIGFGKDGETAIGAGFAATLAKLLGTHLQVHTANGGGATDVRKAFAGSGKNVVENKKLVIWTIASRDLLLSETPGNKAGVMWRDAQFSKRDVAIPENPVDENAPKLEPTLILTGKLKERSSLDDPKQTPYAESLYSALFDVVKVEKGKYAESEAMVFLWGFKDRKFIAETKLQVGDEVRLELVPLPAVTTVKGINKADDLFADLPQFFALKPGLKEETKPATKVIGPLKIPCGFIFFVIGIVAYVIIGLTIQFRQRRAAPVA